SQMLQGLSVVLPAPISPGGADALTPEYQGHYPLRLPKRSVLTTRAHCAAGLITAQALVRERRGAQWRKRLRSAALPGRTARRRTAQCHTHRPHCPAALRGHAHRPRGPAK
ncbi:MAG: hypothetical protein M3Y35_18835, partial [Actinomycetota bacterium]|nr:hypothetical protein [Actinomycetota bacterium]